jgi:hypothetical protein
MTAKNPKGSEPPDDSWLAPTVTIRNLETGDKVVAVETDEVDADGNLVTTYRPITEPLDPRANS